MAKLSRCINLVLVLGLGTILSTVLQSLNIMFILIHIMSLDSLAEMFSQRSGVQQSMGNTIISTIIGFLVQKMMGQGLSNMLSGGSSSSGGGGIGNIQSMLSGLGGMNRHHELVREVQQKAGVKDPEQARQYTQQGLDVLNEQSKNNPQGLQSLLASFMGGGGGSSGQNKAGGGGLGDMIGDVLGG
jgi:hypothetical protein